MSSWLQFAIFKNIYEIRKEGNVELNIFFFNEHFVWSARVSIIFFKKRKYINIWKTFCEIGPYTVSIDLKRKKHWEIERASLQNQNRKKL